MQQGGGIADHTASCTYRVASVFELWTPSRLFGTTGVCALARRRDDAKGVHLDYRKLSRIEIDQPNWH
jgi:hypothetical protein